MRDNCPRKLFEENGVCEGCEDLRFPCQELLVKSIVAEKERLSQELGKATVVTVEAMNKVENAALEVLDTAKVVIESILDLGVELADAAEAQGCGDPPMGTAACTPGACPEAQLRTCEAIVAFRKIDKEIREAHEQEKRKG